MCYTFVATMKIRKCNEKAYSRAIVSATEYQAFYPAPRDEKKSLIKHRERKPFVYITMFIHVDYVDEVYLIMDRFHRRGDHYHPKI